MFKTYLKKSFVIDFIATIPLDDIVSVTINSALKLFNIEHYKF
jgi:hypothetical protein